MQTKRVLKVDAYILQAFLLVYNMIMLPYMKVSDVLCYSLNYMYFQKGLFLRTYWVLESIRLGGFATHYT